MSTITKSYQDGYTGSSLYLNMHKFDKPFRTWLKEKTWFIKPLIEVKIQDTEFIIKKNAFLPMLEAAKTVRRKTFEERIERDANGAIEFEEWDMYEITRYFGTSKGLELQGLERHIRTHFNLDEVRLY